MRLIVTEKPSVARMIASVIGADKKTAHWLEGNGYCVAWCFGHLVEPAEPDKYGGGWAETWSFDQLPMIPDKWKYTVKDEHKEQLAILKQLLNSTATTEVICATDADREGELIFRYVYYLVGCKKPFQRLWISSLEEESIRNGMKKLAQGSVYDNLYHAGLCRARADWLVGMNGSRLFSVRYSQQGQKVTLSIGRVQTPTLAMIVKRDYDVANFVKQKYFTVLLDCGTFKAESERIDEEAKADALNAAVQGQTATVTAIKKSVKTVNPPKLFDLTSLQREANKAFGLTAQETLTALQALYEARLATYPRTDSQYITDDMEQPTLDLVKMIAARYPQFGVGDNINVKRCVNNEKVTGHHAILPTAKIEQADFTKLPEAQRKIMLMLMTRLILATAEQHKYEATKVTVRCADTDFTANGKTVLYEGWKAIERNIRTAFRSKQPEETEKALPELRQGQTFENVTGEKAEHWTSPPLPFTEDTLLSAMEHAGQDDYDDETEKKGIGTPATRAKIIEELLRKGFIQRKGKQLSALPKGVMLISVVPDEVKSPKMTAEWEMQLQQIERGQYSADAFMSSITDYVRQLCADYSQYDNTVSFESEIKNVKAGNCPHCGAEVRKGQYGYYCTAKCGMQLAKVFGKVLTDVQMHHLLTGKTVTFTAKGKKTIVLPEAVAFEYNGKSGWQWATKMG